MIIEFLLLHDEAVAHIRHARECRDDRCDDIAHLYDRLTARYVGLAEVFTFVAGTPRSHQYRLNLARARTQQEMPPTQQGRGLQAIRQAWDEAERGHVEGSG